MANKLFVKVIRAKGLPKFGMTGKPSKCMFSLNNNPLKYDGKYFYQIVWSFYLEHFYNLEQSITIKFFRIVAFKVKVP